MGFKHRNLQRERERERDEQEKAQGMNVLTYRRPLKRVERGIPLKRMKSYNSPFFSCSVLSKDAAVAYIP